MIPQFLLPKGLRAGYVKALFLDEQNHWTGGFFRPVDGRIIFKNVSYIVDERCITRIGMFRTPHIFYILGNAGPIDMRGQITIELSASELYLRQEAHVASDALKEFTVGFFEDRTMLLLLLVMIGGFIFLYYNFDKQLGAISQALGIK